jgi:hypothetical protein
VLKNEENIFFIKKNIKTNYGFEKKVKKIKEKIKKKTT